jgi:transcription factor TFIIIB component B''
VQTLVNDEEPAEASAGAQAPAPVAQMQGEAAVEAAPVRARATRTTRAAPKTGTKRMRQSKRAATIVEDGDQAPVPEQLEGASVEGLPQPAKQPRKRRKKVTAPVPSELQEDVAEEQRMEAVGAEAEESGSDPELHEIDPNTLQMYDVTRWKKYGKVSDREKKMREIDWEEVKRKRNEEIERILTGQNQAKDRGAKKGKDKDKDKAQEQADGVGAGDDGVLETTEGQDDARASNDVDGSNEEGPTLAPGPYVSRDSEEPHSPPAAGLQFRIVNGQIVEDEASLTLARPAAEIAAEAAEPVEEDNDLTTRLNRATFLNDRRREPTERVPIWKTKADPWTEDETERFYEELARWGTDFQLLAAMFPGKSRRMIKTKFNREERIDQRRVGEALLGRHTRSVLATQNSATPTPAAGGDNVAPPAAPMFTSSTQVPQRPQMDLAYYAAATDRPLESFTRYESLAHAQDVIREGMREREEALQAALEEEREVARQSKVAAEQKEKARKEREGKRGAKGGGGGRRKGKMGAGTLGGGQD